MSNRRFNSAIQSHISSHHEHESKLHKELSQLRDERAKLELGGARMAADLEAVKADLRRSTRRNNRLSDNVKVLEDELGKNADAIEEEITCPICSSVM